MADRLPPSEFGGKQKANGIQPPPHQPTASEQLGLVYRTGTDTGLLMNDQEGVVMNGLLPRKIQTAERQSAGDLDKGQAWEAMKQAGNA